MSRSLDGTDGGEDCRDARVNVGGDVHGLGKDDLTKLCVSKLGWLDGNEFQYLRKGDGLHLVVLSIVNSYHESRIRRVIRGCVPIMRGDDGCDASGVVKDETRTITLGRLVDRLAPHCSLVLHRPSFFGLWCCGMHQRLSN